MGDEVRGFDVRRASSSKATRPVTIVRAATPTSREHGRSSAAAIGHGTHQHQAQARLRSARARATARATVSMRFSRVSRPKLRDDDVLGRDAEARAQRAHARASTGVRRHHHRNARPRRGRHLGAHGVDHEVVVAGDEPRGVDGLAEERIGVGQELHRGAELRLGQPRAAPGIRVLELRAILVDARERGRARSASRRIGGVGAGFGRVEEHLRARVMQDEVVEHEQPASRARGCGY